MTTPEPSPSKEALAAANLDAACEACANIVVDPGFWDKLGEPARRQWRKGMQAAFDAFIPALTEDRIKDAIAVLRPAPVGDELAKMILADCTDTTPQAWIDAATALVGKSPPLDYLFGWESAERGEPIPSWRQQWPGDQERLRNQRMGWCDFHNAKQQP